MVIIPVLAIVHCSRQPGADAGSSVSGNARVAGILFNENGTPAVSTEVELFPSDYNPRQNDTLPPAYTTTTDQQGAFSFDPQDSGAFNIQATGTNHTAALIKNVFFSGNSIDIPAATLRSPGVIKMMLPEEKV